MTRFTRLFYYTDNKWMNEYSLMQIDRVRPKSDCVLYSTIDVLTFPSQLSQF